MSALDLVKTNPHPGEREIREWLEGNLCRCTGYHNIVKSIAAGRRGNGTRRMTGARAPAVRLARGIDSMRPATRRLATLREHRPFSTAKLGSWRLARRHSG